MRGVIKTYRLGWAGFLVLFCLALSMDAGGQTGDLPCQPSGSVKYKGQPVPDGREVIALIQGNEYTKTEVEDGRYTLSIPADDPSTTEKEGWEKGEYITLRVQGYSGATLFEAKSGNLPVDINLTTMGVLNLTTWGKIKALFK
jgi:hypothetical protein